MLLGLDDFRTHYCYSFLSSRAPSDEEVNRLEFAIRFQRRTRRAMAYSRCFKQDIIFTGRFEFTILSGVVRILDVKTSTPLHFGPPEGSDYFRLVPKPKHTSRRKEDWEELELLGRGLLAR